MAIPIIIDCDPGHDDTFGILLAAGSDAVDLRAVTTVAGNQSIENVTRNAQNVLTLAAVSDVPVGAGRKEPLIGYAGIALGDVYSGPDIHGRTGLDGWDFPEPTVQVDPRDAVTLMADVLHAAQEPVTIVATGPQTNVAALLLAHPWARESIREIVCMAGSTQRGNFLPYSEANVLFDPEAASIVLASGVRVRYCGLNVTLQALVTEEVLEAIAEVPRIGEAAAALLRFRSGTYDRVFGMPEPPLHDPVAVSMVVDPSLVRCQEANIAIELHGQYTRGASVIDLGRVTTRPPNAGVAVEIDVPGFWKLLISALWKLA
jgi:purine nucleosidase/pyrimidine-specific ribonucleoside hydrolase